MAETHKLAWKKCSCGHPSCRYWQPNIGSYHQGTGFDEEEKALLDRAFAALSAAPASPLTVEGIAEALWVSDNPGENEISWAEWQSYAADKPWLKVNTVDCVFRRAAVILDRLSRQAVLMGAGSGFQARSAAWMKTALADDPTDMAERRARFGEEAIELQHALGATREDLHALVDYICGRPVGDPGRELGQAAFTLACLAEFAGLSMMDEAERELARCSTPEFLARLAAKRATRHGRGPLPGHDPTPPKAKEPQAKEERS